MLYRHPSHVEGYRNIRTRSATEADFHTNASDVDVQPTQIELRLGLASCLGLELERYL
jgi:hypothetical protein